MNSEKGLLLDLMSIPVGSVLWEVWALDKPKELGGKESYIADVILSEAMTTSKWGDRDFFIRHQSMDVDLLQHKEWTDYCPKFRWRQPKAKKCLAKASGCPFG